MLTVSFHQKQRKDRFKSIALSLLVTVFCFYYSWLYIRLVNLSGGVEENPSPKSKLAQYFKIYQRNLNSTAGHNLIKVALLKGYFQSIIWILNVCLKHTLTALFQLIMLIFKSLVTAP